MTKYKDPVEEVLAQLPPASVNNSRAIVRAKIERFKRYPSERLAEEIKKLTGLEADWSDADYGEPPAKYNENH